MASGVGLRPALASGDVLPGLQDGPGYGKSQALVLGNPPQTLAHGQFGLRLSPLFTQQRVAILVQDLLRAWCHRTGKRYREAAIPLSRIRAALSSLWLAYPPTFSTSQETPG